MPNTGSAQLDSLIKQALAAVSQLSPEEQRNLRRDQSISWVHGEMLMTRFERGQPDLTEEQQEKQLQMIAEIYDKRNQ